MPLLEINKKYNYLYTTVKLCDALLEGVATDDTLMVAVHQCCWGRLMSCRLLAAVVLVTAAFWAILVLVLWSNRVVSIVIPLDEGMVEVSVAVTANPLVKEILLLLALMVKATGVSTGATGGGVGVDPPPLDLEQEIMEPITIGSKTNIFFILNGYLLIMTPTV